jgi:hypothetical protein
MKGAEKRKMVENMNDPFSQSVGGGRENALPGQSQWNPSQGGNQGGQATNQGGGILNNPLGAVRQQIEDQIGQAVDHYAGHVPGGDKYAPEAKQAIAGVLDGLQNQLENEAASRLGGLGGELFGGSGTTGNNQGGIL